MSTVNPAGRRVLGVLQWLHRTLLLLPPEAAHDIALAGLEFIERRPRWLAALSAPLPVLEEVDLRQELLGSSFPHPIGLAAGFDKNARVIAAMAGLGFGFVEVGTVTPRAQKGNTKPRMFRHRSDRSLENALGFNNAGVEAMALRLERSYPAVVPLGVNIGKNKATPNDCALADYLEIVQALDGHADYFVINVSSPNTPGLRQLQDERFLGELLQETRRRTAAPVLIKLAPDLETARLVKLARAAVAAGAAGLVISNTTTDRTLLPAARGRRSMRSAGMCGLSGQVLRQRSYDLLRAVAAELFGSCCLISVGGIDSGQEVWRRLRGGASLVQIYTGLVYGGPGLVAKILMELAEEMHGAGRKTLHDAIGLDVEV